MTLLRSTLLLLELLAGSSALRLATSARTSRISCSAETSNLKVLVPIGEGSEEIETACIQDVLVRAGASVTVASVMPSLQVKMSRGLQILADCSIDECIGQDWAVIACPGGMPGAEYLRDSAPLTNMLKEQHAAGKLCAAVCASPAVVFKTHGILSEVATCYPAPVFKDSVGSGWQDYKVVTEGNVITSQGPGTSLQFALKIVAVLFGDEKAQELAQQMVTTTDYRRSPGDL